METVVYILQILIWVLCPVIIGLILLQGAAGDLSSSFGGGGVLDSTLGVGAHRKMSKATGILAGIFFVIILFLAYQHHHGFSDVKSSPAPAKKAVEAPKPDAAKPQAPAVAPEMLTAPSAPKAEIPAGAVPVEAAKPDAVPAPVAPAVVPAPVVVVPAAPAAPVAAPAAPVEAKPEAPAAKP